jgi:predicted transcriptional regulator
MNLAPTNGGATRKNPVQDPLREYLYTLIENNLLEYAKGTRTYKTTAKGLNFLKKQPNGKHLQMTVGQR